MSCTLVLPQRVQVLVRALTILTHKTGFSRVETFDVARQAVFVDGLITIGTLHKVGA